MEQQSLPEDLKRIDDLEFDLKIAEEKNEQLQKDYEELKGELKASEDLVEERDDEIESLEGQLKEIEDGSISDGDIEIESLMGGRILINFEGNASNGIYSQIFEEIKEIFENPKVKELDILDQLKSLNNLTK